VRHGIKPNLAASSCTNQKKSAASLIKVVDLNQELPMLREISREAVYTALFIIKFFAGLPGRRERLGLAACQTKV
jgi:hypothetical protein